MDPIEYELFQCLECTTPFIMSTSDVYMADNAGTVHPVCPHCGAEEFSDTHGHLQEIIFLNKLEVEPFVPVDADLVPSYNLVGLLELGRDAERYASLVNSVDEEEFDEQDPG